MAGSDNNNNEQWKVSQQFLKLRLQQKEKKMEVRKMLLSHILPEELWDIILDLVFNADSIVAYFEFKRKDQFYMDDHYLFRGSEKGWCLALEKMRSNVNLLDLQDDIPTDTYCSGVCDLIRLMDGAYFACPDEEGDKCDCHWTHHVFTSEDDFNAYYYAKKRHVSCIYNASGGRLWCLHHGDTPSAPYGVSPSHPHCPGIVKMPINGGGYTF